MQIGDCSRSGAHSLVWRRDSACLDYNGGEMRGGRGGFWEEMKRGVWGKRGSELHDREDGRRTKERVAQRMSKPVKSVQVTCVKTKKR